MGDRSPVYGSWDPNALFPIYMLTGIFFGMVELIRRVIPRDIVGGDIHKLRKMDAVVCSESLGIVADGRFIFVMKLRERAQRLRLQL
jgi:hypothetical protein